MKLSEAIRLGAALSQQAFRVFIREGGDTCALGAASIAAGLDVRKHECPEIMFAFPELLMGGVGCPACHEMPVFDLGSTITHLNDTHRWSREHIADWVELNFESVPEPKQIPETVEAK